MRSQLTFYRSFREAIKCLPDEDRLKAYEAIIDYALDEEEPSCTGAAMAVFLMAKPTLDNARIKAESGSTGGTNGLGVPKKPKANEKQNESKPKANEKQAESKIEVKNKIEIKNDSLTPYSPPRGFDEFWQAYPKKVGKQAALKSFVKVIKTVSLQTLLSAIERQKRGLQWSRDNGQFIPNPATWLNQGRWEDETEVRSEASETPRATASDLDEMNEYLRRLTR